ncbi:hypothetical protein [Streptomyces sp. HNM1019]
MQDGAEAVARTTQDVHRLQPLAGWHGDEIAVLALGVLASRP